MSRSAFLIAPEDVRTLEIIPLIATVSVLFPNVCLTISYHSLFTGTELLGPIPVLFLFLAPLGGGGGGGGNLDPPEFPGWEKSQRSELQGQEFITTDFWL